MRPLFQLILGINLMLHSQMVTIQGGVYEPLYGGLNPEVQVQSFNVDQYPVTIAQYEAFVRANPEWRRSRVKPIYADKMYLHRWVSDTLAGPEFLPNSPVTEVSWFAAKAYCKWRNKRLLSTDEWEYVAMASETASDARRDSLFNLRIISWYERPNTHLNAVGQNTPNKWGVYDLNALVWEWVSDFNSIIMTGESRSDNALERNLFCAAGSVGASDLMNYAAFMRYAFRGSIKARYCMKNLGFRCGSDK